jgi:carbon-monoxide dehydrogenase medium subunit
MFARPGLPRFDYVRAGTVDEAVALLVEYVETARPVMGGTDLFANMRDGKIRPSVVVDVKHLPAIRDVVYDEGLGLTAGAAATMNELVRHAGVQAHYPLLAQAAGAVASYQIRNRATLGGNLCNASPCADAAPAALVLQAEFVLYGPKGQRVVPAEAFFLGPGQTALQPGELMTAVHCPLPPPNAAARYLKLGRCRSGDLSLVGVAVLGFRDGTASGYRFRIAMGSVAPTPVRALDAEEFLAENPLGEEAFLQAAEKAVAAANPITDVRGTAQYQKAMVRTLTLRGLRDVWTQLKEGK